MATTPASPSIRVAVIGAGAAGLAALRALLHPAWKAADRAAHAPPQADTAGTVDAHSTAAARSPDSDPSDGSSASPFSVVAFESGDVVGGTWVYGTVG